MICASEQTLVEARREALLLRIDHLRATRKQRELGVSLMVGSLAPPLAVLAGIELFGAVVGASYFADRSRGGSWQYAPLGALLGLVVTPRLYGQTPFSSALEASVATASALLIGGLVVFLTSLVSEPHPLERLIQTQTELRALNEAK